MLNIYNIDAKECKYCSKCDKWQPLTAHNKNKSIWDGFERRCCQCSKEYRQQAQSQTREKPHFNRKHHRFTQNVEEKQCYCCKIWRNLDNFVKNRTIWDGLDRKCRLCSSEYRRKNKEVLSPWIRPD